MQEVYKKYLGGTTLRLLYKASTGTIEAVKDVVIKNEARASARFSHDSKFLAIFMKNLNILKLYRIGSDELPEINFSARSGAHDRHPLSKTFADVEGDRYTKKYEENMEWVETIAFDRRERLLLLQGTGQIEVLDFSDPSTEAFTSRMVWKLQSEQGRGYERIYDAKLESFIDEDTKKLEFQVQLACKVSGKKQIDIFRAFAEDEYDARHMSSKRSLTYTSDNISDMNVRISNNFEKVILTNINENYIMESSIFNLQTIEQISHASYLKKSLDEEDEYQMTTNVRQLPQLKNQIVRYINLAEDGSFFLVACHEYDQSLDILYSEDFNFKVEFDYKIEPQTIKVFDFITLEQDGKHYIRVASSRDEQFNLNSAYIDIEADNAHLKKAHLGAHQTSDRFSPKQALSMKWPYITYSGIDKRYLLIINLYQKNQIHRVRLPEENAIIIHTYITETNDLFVVVMTQDSYKIKFIDLDASNRREQDDVTPHVLYNQFRFQDVLEYSCSEVKNQPFMDMVVRGSSRKEVIDVNEKLVVVLLHSDSLYKKVVYSPLTPEQQAEEVHFLKKLAATERVVDQQLLIQHFEHEKRVKRERNLVELDFVCETPSIDLARIDDYKFFVLEEKRNEKGQIHTQEIAAYTISFSDIERAVIHSEYANQERIINFSVDSEANKLVIFSLLPRLKEGQNHRVTIFDL